MIGNVVGRARQSAVDVRGLMRETLAGALVGAAGGLVFGLCFGSLRWAALHEAAIGASAWSGTWAAAVAGSVAGLANMAFGWEPVGWEEVLGALGKGRECKSSHRPSPRLERGLGQVSASTGAAPQAPGLPSRWAANGDPGKSGLR